MRSKESLAVKVKAKSHMTSGCGSQGKSFGGGDRLHFVSNFEVVSIFCGHLNFLGRLPFWSFSIWKSSSFLGTSSFLKSFFYFMSSFY